MDRVKKTFFDPLATSKDQIRGILQDLPVGSAHPFSPEQILLCRRENGIEEIDISSYPEDFFFNAVDLGEMGEVLLRRMAKFGQLKGFDDFQIEQAPASTFKIPIVSNEITMLAVSERTPTYYDFCFSDKACNTCCYAAQDTFKGINHSGDVNQGIDFLAYVTLNKDALTDQELCVFISGFQYTPITRFLGTHPALLVANHEDKVLYIIPVPLDAATLGQATICCPLVIKRDSDNLICSILPSAATDTGKMCSGRTLPSPTFPEAIGRADFTFSTPIPTTRQGVFPDTKPVKVDTESNSESLRRIMSKDTAVFTTDLAILPSFLNLEMTQIIKFGTGIEFKLSDEEISTNVKKSVVLPCIMGTQLQGPVILATGSTPSNVPFSDGNALRDYYEKLRNIVVIANEQMTDNARNLATSYRINALFIIQLSTEKEPNNADEIMSLLNSANINAATALAGPQSLVLIQISTKYYFYRGLANRTLLNTSKLEFGADVTSVLESVGMNSIIDPRAKRLINLDDANAIILPTSGQFVKPQDLQKLFDDLPVDQLQTLEEDLSSAVPQLQVLLNQTELQELSKVLISTLSEKVNKVTAPLRNKYIKFLTQEYQSTDPALAKKKGDMLGELRKTTKELQTSLESAISSLSNMMSSQTTSKRTHDLKRLVRQAQIQGNIEAVKSMTFDTLSGYLETYAADMGVMLLNIETTPYRQLLNNLTQLDVIDANPCCDLDTRVLYLGGFDAGIIIEQSQSNHTGPLQSQSGPAHPILALPYLSQERGTGSMLAWVCWDEFVDLKSPYTVRWMEKCNEPHIAALRIMMRDTLSRAVASRDHNMQPGSSDTGNLMTALLMSSMKKLAGMRTTTPTVLEKADDTVTRLMRGLFGNLLTIAGSGVRPLSMVWQLFGLNSAYEIPTTATEWMWYETVTSLYPYTGWPLKQFSENLEKFLDKIILRVITKNENVAEIKLNFATMMVDYCKQKNIQLDHSRTIITIFMRMLTENNVDVAAVAARLLDQIPDKLQRQTQSYTKMINYLKHLAKGGQRRTNDDLVAASVYTKRSAAFSELKNEVSTACKAKNWNEVRKLCQKLIDKHAEIATLWNIKPELLKIQNMKAYTDLLANDFGDEAEVDKETQAKHHKLSRQALDDAERKRVPWQIGKENEFGANIEPLDEAFLHEILTGSKPKSLETVDLEKKLETVTTIIVKKTIDEEIGEFKSSLQSRFVTAMQKKLSPEDVCTIMKIPTSTMLVFVKFLNPGFVLENLGENFKVVVLELLQDRSGRAGSRPVKILLELGKVGEKTLQIEG